MKIKILFKMNIKKTLKYSFIISCIKNLKYRLIFIDFYFLSTCEQKLFIEYDEIK